jgi:YHS domain-containing protein/DNA-binding transcriptional ArsR family regulator
MNYEQIFHHQTTLFKSIAHPKRLEIVQLLVDQDLPVTDIFSMLDLPQDYVSKQLAVLKKANIVHVVRQGKQLVYGVKDQRLKKILKLSRDIAIDQQPGRIEEELKQSFAHTFPSVVDPVCGMSVTPRSASAGVHWEGKAYYFCGSGCKKNFELKPEKYI